jgi:large exoprotein involved in heme utilization and adhesion
VNDTLQRAFRLPLIPSGFSGNIIINTDQLKVTDGARVEVSNQGTGNAGALKINAKSIFLHNQGDIKAATASGEGGNIDLKVTDLLLMRLNSQISANASGIGKGGNIDINTPLLVAVDKENSDIGANSVNSRGGRVTISAQGIFGIQFRDAPTLKSDVTATGANSALNGRVQIKTPDIDATKALLKLPINISDPTNLISQGCPAHEGNSFTITGRGGLPSLPNEALHTIQTANPNWVKIPQSKRQAQIINNPKIKISNPIVEATGWTKNKSGEVILVASAPEVSNISPTPELDTCEKF